MSYMVYITVLFVLIIINTFFFWISESRRKNSNKKIALFLACDMVRLDLIEKYLLSQDSDAKVGLQHQGKSEAS